MATQEGDDSRMKPLVSYDHCDEKNGSGRGLIKRIWEEEKKLFRITGPAIFTRLSTFGVSMVSQAFMGHIGSTELAAYALVFTVIVRFANGILMGMASALETLCGQSFGARQYRMLGIYLQRSWIVLLPFTVALIPLFLFTRPVLLMLGQDKAVALMAGKISLWSIAVLFSYGLSFTLQMYLQAQSKNRVITYYAAISLPMHALFSWMLTRKFDLKVNGVMGSMIIAFWVPVVGQLLFVVRGGCPETWGGFSIDAFKDLGAIIKLSLSSGVMLCLEIWYNSVLILLTGNRKDSEISIDALSTWFALLLDKQFDGFTILELHAGLTFKSLSLSISGWGMTIALGFLAGVGVRVANQLGSGSAEKAKFSILVGSGTSAIIGIALFLAVFRLRGDISYIFSSSPLVADAVADLSPLLEISVLLNSIQPVLTGAAIGAGRQSGIAYVNIACYYLVGIPLGVLLGYRNGLGIKGVWLGMIAGMTVQTLALLCITCRTDWNHQVFVARSRLQRWSMMNSDKECGENVGI